MYKQYTRKYCSPRILGKVTKSVCTGVQTLPTGRAKVGKGSGSRDYHTITSGVQWWSSAFQHRISGRQPTHRSQPTILAIHSLCWRLDLPLFQLQFYLLFKFSALHSCIWKLNWLLFSEFLKFIGFFFFGTLFFKSFFIHSWCWKVDFKSSTISQEPLNISSQIEHFFI